MAIVYRFVSHLGEFRFGSGCKFQIIRAVFFSFFKTVKTLDLGVDFHLGNKLKD